MTLVFLSSCRPVFYDQNIALDAILISKMQKIADLGTIRINTDDCMDDYDNKLFFLPDKDVLEPGYANTGFICLERRYDLNIWYRNEYKNISERRQHQLRSYDDRKPHYLLEPIQSDEITGKTLFFLNFYTQHEESTLVGNSRYNLLEYNNETINWIFPGGDMMEAGESLEAKISNDTPAINESGYSFVNGAFISPVDQQLHLLYMLYDSGINESYYYDLFYGFGYPSGYLNIGYLNSLYIFESAICYTRLDEPFFTDFFYYYDVRTLKSFISYQPASGFENYYWNSDCIIGGTHEIEKQRLPYNVPVNAYLSTSDFLSYKDNSVTVYNQAGNKINTYEVGNLRFVYEIIDPVTNEGSMIFVYCIQQPTHDCSEMECTVTIYSYPTADIDKL